MENYDVIVVGAGLLGCFAARSLARYEMNILCIEAREDICTGISRANTGIVYTGADTAPGTLKTQLCVKANASFDALCRELDVAFSRCGSLMAAFGEEADARLDKKFAMGRENGVPGLELLPREEVLRRESALGKGVRRAIYAPGSGTVNPWELGIAAFENAKANGVSFHLNEKVEKIARTEGGFMAETSRGTYSCRAVVNCAGLSADVLRELTERPLVRIFPKAGDYFVTDTSPEGAPKHIIFHEPEQKGKGLTLVPTVEGNILIGPTEREDGNRDFATDVAGLEELRRLCATVVPSLDMGSIIRSFGALRPNPYYVRETAVGWEAEERGISSFTLLDEAGLYSLVGIKTPGLTCADGLGKLTADKVAAYLGCDALNARFEPRRRGIVKTAGLSAVQRNALIARDPDYGRIVCRCKGVSLAEVREAIARGATTVDGVKRRTGAGMGRCQGGYCLPPVLETLGGEATKDGGGTRIVYGKI